jgi:hypothetical protein
MTKSKSPGAVAALGAFKIDQLGSTVDPRNSPINLIAQARPRRAGNASRCLVCGSAIKPRRASRRQRYCSFRCRDEARRARNFAASGATRKGDPAIPRSVQKDDVESTTCNAGSAELRCDCARAGSSAFPRRVFDEMVQAGATDD